MSSGDIISQRVFERNEKHDVSSAQLELLFIPRVTSPFLILPILHFRL